VTNEHRKISHALGRRRATDRKQARKSRRAETEHLDRYSAERMRDQLAALAERFKSEERAHERS